MTIMKSTQTYVNEIAETMHKWQFQHNFVATNIHHINENCKEICQVINEKCYKRDYESNIVHNALQCPDANTLVERFKGR